MVSRQLLSMSLRPQMVATMLVAALGALVAASNAACGDDVAAYSETISLKLSGLKDGDINAGNASEDKSINTEEGNPYGDFLKAAKSRLGRDPGAIEVTSVIVKVHPDSKDVATLDQVFDDLEVYLSTSETVITIGSVSSVSGSTQTVPVKDNIDYEPVFDRMLDGNFKMGIRGKTVSSPPASFDLKLVLDVKFRALE